MNIWSPLIQKFPQPEAGAVFFFANQNALTNMPSSDQQPAFDVNAGIAEKNRMLSAMGTFQYTLAVIDVTTITEDQIIIRAQEIDGPAFAKFAAWMCTEFPYVEKKRSLVGESAHWFVLRDADLIKFRYMFQYIK